MMWEGVVWCPRRRRNSLDLLYRKVEDSVVNYVLVLFGEEDVQGPAVGHLHGEEGLVDLQLEQGGQKCPGQILLHHNHLSSSTLVESTAPHPAGEPGCLDGLAGVLGKIWATAL